MQVHIRPVILSDAAAIAILSGQLGYTSGIEATQNRIQLVLGTENNCAFAAIFNDNLIGWIHGFYTFRIESEPFVEIGGLVVDENFRKNGIGKLLVEKVEQWAAGHRVKKIRVRCNVKRTETHAFYKCIGYAGIKEQQIFDKEL